MSLGAWLGGSGFQSTFDLGASFGVLHLPFSFEWLEVEAFQGSCRRLSLSDFPWAHTVLARAFFNSQMLAHVTSCETTRVPHGPLVARVPSAAASCQVASARILREAHCKRIFIGLKFGPLNWAL